MKAFLLHGSLVRYEIDALEILEKVNVANCSPSMMTSLLFLGYLHYSIAFYYTCPSHNPLIETQKYFFLR